MDSLCNNTRTDMNYVIYSKFDVGYSDYRTNSILSEISNSQKAMNEFLEINCWKILIAADKE